MPDKQTKHKRKNIFLWLQLYKTSKPEVGSRLNLSRVTSCQVSYTFEWEPPWCYKPDSSQLEAYNTFLYKFPIAFITTCNKPGALKQSTLIVLQLCRSEVTQGSPCAEISHQQCSFLAWLWYCISLFGFSRSRSHWHSLAHGWLFSSSRHMIQHLAEPVSDFTFLSLTIARNISWLLRLLWLVVLTSLSVYSEVF